MRLKTGLRDIRRHNKKYLIKEIPSINNPEAEDEIIARLDNEIEIINEKTGSLYSTSYICKRIKAIRSVMESYGLAP